MTTHANEALDELRKGLRIFRAFEKAEGVIALLQSAEQRTAEAQLQLSHLRPQVDAAKGEFDAMVLSTEKIVADARAAAAEITRVAMERADAIVTAANKKVIHAERVHADTLSKAQEDLAVIQNEAELAKIARDAAVVELDDLEKKIAKVRARAEQLLGA
jgi:hypothetical protein